LINVGHQFLHLVRREVSINLGKNVEIDLLASNDPGEDFVPPVICDFLGPVVALEDVTDIVKMNLCEINGSI
jgi:hypothetical protein